MGPHRRSREQLSDIIGSLRALLGQALANVKDPQSARYFIEAALRSTEEVPALAAQKDASDDRRRRVRRALAEQKVGANRRRRDRRRRVRRAVV